MHRGAALLYEHAEQVQDPLVLCVIDGDKLLFGRSLIGQGAQGGRKAAENFTKAVAQELVQQSLIGFERLSFWVTIYLNKRAVMARLAREGIASPEQFEDFLVGFGQASPRFLIMDVGPGREQTEVKVKGTSSPIRYVDSAHYRNVP